MSATTPMSYHSHVPLRRPWAWPVHPPFKPRLSQTQENPPTSTQENGKCGWGLWWISWKVRKWGKCQRRCCFSFCLSRYCSCSSCWFFFFYCMHKYPAVLAALDGWTGYLGVVLQSSNCWALKAILRGQSRCKRLQLLICAQKQHKSGNGDGWQSLWPQKMEKVFAFLSGDLLGLI